RDHRSSDDPAVPVRSPTFAAERVCGVADATLRPIESTMAAVESGSHTSARISHLSISPPVDRILPWKPSNRGRYRSASAALAYLDWGPIYIPFLTPDLSPVASQLYLLSHNWVLNSFKGIEHFGLPGSFDRSPVFDRIHFPSVERKSSIR